MIEAAECAGMSATESMLRPAETSPAGEAATMKSAGAIEVVAVDENPAVGDVGAVVESNPVIMPIVPPVSPAPTKPTKEADPKAEAKE